jgi:DnaJ-class molecular chaperone
MLQKAYKVLSDPKKRERYDQWGDDGTDTFNSKEWMNAYEYYRALNPEITKKDYKSYIATYKNSDTEKEDLKKFYNEMKGDMRGLLEHIIASENSDIPRFIEFF